MTDVTHPDHPNEVGTINRVVTINGEPWYRVTWPSGIGDNAMYPCSLGCVEHWAIRLSDPNCWPLLPEEREDCD